MSNATTYRRIPANRYAEMMELDVRRYPRDQRERLLSLAIDLRASVILHRRNAGRASVTSHR